ncbi:hypothetical protein [Solicola gregarius]|uniref:Uncharacterized protein n=1 Tax=Solicola gregarius TaxID=2908642 RepID=A0AA46TIT8_9ACTN|nr:hypothetical protein [Solicola gregarius]UYM05642.1 hypothetical protein L0C25_00720 [Solicola gregarius]
MSEKRFALAFGIVVSALTVGLVATVGLSGPASASPTDSASGPPPVLSLASKEPSATTRAVVDDWPEHEWAGDIYVAGTYGYAMFDDYDANIQNHFDRDNFYVVDVNGDGMHVSLSVTHNGKTYTEHDAGGKAAFIDVGNISNGETVQLKACVWTTGHTLYQCVENQLTE